LKQRIRRIWNLYSDRTIAIVVSLALHGALFLLPPVSIATTNTVTHQKRVSVDLILDTDKTSMSGTSRNAPKDNKDDKATLHDALPRDPTPSHPTLVPSLASTGKDAANVPVTPVSQDMSRKEESSPKEESSARQDASPKQEARAPAPILLPSSNVISSSVSKSLPNAPQKETRKNQQQNGTLAFSDQLATIPSKADSTVASTGRATTLSSPPSLAPATASSPATGEGIKTAAQEAPAAPTELGFLANPPETTISEPNPFSGTTGINYTNNYKENTYTNIDNQNSSDGKDHPSIGAFVYSQSATDQVLVNPIGTNQTGTDKVSATQSVENQNETSQVATKQALTNQVTPGGESPSSGSTSLVAQSAQPTTKPASRITSAQEILDLLSEQLSTKKTYPDAARQRHIEGKVRVGMSIAADGSLKSVRVLAKSGSTILDRAAVTLVSELFPLSKQLEKAMDVAVTIEYKLVE